MVTLVLDDSITEVPEGILGPEDRLEHQAGVGRLVKHNAYLILAVLEGRTYGG